MKVSVDGEMLMSGDTVRVTATVCGELVAPGAVAVIVTVPVCGPTGTVVLFTDTTSVLGAVLVPGGTLSQAPPDAVMTDAVEFSVPPPEFVIITF